MMFTVWQSISMLDDSIPGSSGCFHWRGAEISSALAWGAMQFAAPRRFANVEVLKLLSGRARARTLPHGASLYATFSALLEAQQGFSTLSFPHDFGVIIDLQILIERDYEPVTLERALHGDPLILTNGIYADAPLLQFLHD